MSNQQPKPLSRGDLMAVIGHLQDVIGRAQTVTANDRAPNRAAATTLLLTHAHALCIAVRSTESPTFGSRSPYTKLEIPDTSKVF